MSSSAGPDAPAHIDPGLAARIAERPGDVVAVIVTSASTMAALEAALPSDVTIAHAYRLIRSLAIEARGTTILALAAHPDVAAIEAVRDVEAWSP